MARRRSLVALPCAVLCRKWALWGGPTPPRSKCRCVAFALAAGPASEPNTVLSLSSQGVFLVLDFKPVVKSAEEHEAVLALLARPLKNQAQVSAVPSTPKKKAPPAAPTVVTDDGKVDESMAQYMAKKARGRTRPEEPTPRATRRGAKGALSDDDLDRVGTPFKEKK